METGGAIFIKLAGFANLKHVTTSTFAELPELDKLKKHHVSKAATQSEHHNPSVFQDLKAAPTRRSAKCTSPLQT